MILVIKVAVIWEEAVSVIMAAARLVVTPVVAISVMDVAISVMEVTMAAVVVVMVIVTTIIHGHTLAYIFFGWTRTSKEASAGKQTESLFLGVSINVRMYAPCFKVLKKCALATNVDTINVHK